MSPILRYISKYFYETDKRLLVLVSLFTALLIILNYRFQGDNWISKSESLLVRFICRYFIFGIAFWVPYILTAITFKYSLLNKSHFVFLLLIAPAIFSLKAGLRIHINFCTSDLLNEYWNQIIYWPILLLMVCTLLFVCWKAMDPNQPFYGTSTSNIKLKPYWLMLLFMLPLVGMASTQTDFQHVYPKLSRVFDAPIQSQLSWWHRLLFELSYGSDFLGIELFFRGFLVLAFVKWAGMRAILPMACFYCTIHFGKPLGECISSYFGGLLLGIIVYNTRSIWGGLLVHLGIAWLMELAGFIIQGEIGY